MALVRERWILITVIYLASIVALSAFAWIMILKASEYAVVPWSLNLSTSELLQREHEYRLGAIQTLTGVAQLFGGSALIIGLLFTWKNLQLTDQNARSTQMLSQESQLTERFGRAVDQLGSERLEIRLGGIYALERIARDSERDHWSIMEVLTAFVRERGADPRRGTKDTIRIGATADIQAAMTVLGRRSITETREKGVLDLHGADLSDVNLENLNFAKALFVNTSFRRAYLKGTSFLDASLRNADFSDAVLEGINVKNADLNGVQGLSSPSSHETQK